MATKTSNGDRFELSDEVEKLKIRALERMDSQASSTIVSPSGASPGATQRGTFRSHRTEPFIIGVAGGTASGKTTVCDQIVQRLNGKPNSMIDFPLPASKLKFASYFEILKS
jgi:pantothenate kinase